MVCACTKNEAFRQQQDQAEARLLGAHLEGPFLAPNKRGARPRRHVQPLTLVQLQQLMDGFSAEDMALVTMAPELDARHEAMGWLVEQGVVVAAHRGQPAASSGRLHGGGALVDPRVQRHAPLHHQAPGPVDTIRNEPEPVFLGLIADGVHVAWCWWAPYGLAEGRYPWGNGWITVHQGTCRADRGILRSRCPGAGPHGLRSGAPRQPPSSRRRGHLVDTSTLAPPQLE